MMPCVLCYLPYPYSVWIRSVMLESAESKHPWLIGCEIIF